MTTPAAVPSSRSWNRAVRDLRDGYAMRELWAHLGWQAIKQRYRRSVIGPLWITISMGVTAVGLGVLYSVLFGQPIKTFLPYVVVGFIVWNFINGWPASWKGSDLSSSSDEVATEEVTISHEGLERA